MSDGENNEEKKEKKKGAWAKFRAMSLNAKFAVAFGFVMAVFALLILIFAMLTRESQRPGSGVEYPNWYGFLIGMGIVVCAVCGQFASLKQGYYFDLIFDYVIFAVPMAFFGGVFYYAASNNWNWYGIGVIGALIGAVVGLLLAMFVYRTFVKKKPKVSLLQMLDLAGVFVLLGQAIGRIGCYMAIDTCCYGIPVEFDVFPFSYRVGGVLHLGNPFIESLWCLVGFVALVSMYMSKRKSFNGFYISLYCIWYGIGRFVLEFFRDPSHKLQLTGGLGDGFGISQLTSLLMIAFGVAWIVAYLIRAAVTKKKFMIMIPREKLSEDYCGYTQTIYFRPHVDAEGRPIDYSASEKANGTNTDERRDG